MIALPEMGRGIPAFPILPAVEQLKPYQGSMLCLRDRY